MSDSDHPNSTTFVQADPSNFRAVVQRLTGATPTQTPPHTSGFKLHERRQTTRKLEITLNNRFHNQLGMMSPSARHQMTTMMTMPSPVSTLDHHVYGRESPKTPVEGEEERAIAEKGFYLHPSPVHTPRGYEPELLVLFPLHSPKNDPSSSSSSSF